MLILLLTKQPFINHAPPSKSFSIALATYCDQLQTVAELGLWELGLDFVDVLKRDFLILILMLSEEEAHWRVSWKWRVSL